MQGIQTAIKKNKPLLSQEEMNATLVQLKKKIVADQQLSGEEGGRENRKSSAAFLAENAKQKGVTVLPSGVQYKIIKEGSGQETDPEGRGEGPLSHDQRRRQGARQHLCGRQAEDLFRIQGHPGAPAGPARLMAEGAKLADRAASATKAGGGNPLDDMGALIYELELLTVKTAPTNTTK